MGWVGGGCDDLDLGAVLQKPHRHGIHGEASAIQGWARGFVAELENAHGGRQVWALLRAKDATPVPGRHGG